jgi:5'-3' exonuclease
MPDFVKIAVILGCDYCPGGVRGVGPATVLDKFKTIEFDEEKSEQLEAMACFQAPIACPPIENTPGGDAVGVREWLATRGFSAKTLARYFD